MLENSSNTQFHTYTPKDKKQHAFVLKGLQAITETDEIQEELMQEYGLKTNKIYRMKNTKNPLFLIITGNEITLKLLQSTIKYLFHTKITWKRRHNERTITQCRRCQTWGHATTNCHRTPKCVKCGNDHWTRDCEKPKETPPKCANCGGQHTACNIECPVYKKKIETTTKPVPEQRTKHVEAPTPKTNIWIERQKERQKMEDERPIPRQERLREEERQPQTTSIQNDYTDFMTLSQEMNKLNKKINLKETIKAIIELNRMLETVTDSMQAIAVVQEFTSSVLPKFNITPLSRSG